MIGNEKIELVDLETNNYESDRKKSAGIGLSDVVLTLHYLVPQSEKTKKAILDALGFEWQTADDSEPDYKFPSSGDPAAAPKTGNLPTEIKTGNSQTASRDAKILQPHLETEIDFNDIFTDVIWEDFEALSETNLEKHFEKPRYMPLFEGKWFRAIISLILSTSMPTTEIDFKLTEKSIVRLSPIDRVPYRHSQSLERGVQILLDISESMQPFWRDETELIASLSGLLDAHKITVSEFTLDIRSQPRMIWEKGSPESLHPEVPVLIVSNFDVTGDRNIRKIEDIEPLLNLLTQSKNKKCPIAALVPLSEENFPQDLKTFIPFSFVWDRSTSPQVVRRIKK